MRVMLVGRLAKPVHPKERGDDRRGERGRGELKVVL
jgi:hypothetical protein